MRPTAIRLGMVADISSVTSLRRDQLRPRRAAFVGRG
jgi:hypothetical protein